MGCDGPHRLSWGLPHTYGVWRPLRFVRRVLRQLLPNDLDRFFELRVVAGVHFSGPLLDLDVWRDAFVFHHPAAIGRPEGEVGSGHAAAIQHYWEAGRANFAARRTLANDRAQLRLMEHPG